MGTITDSVPMNNNTTQISTDEFQVSEMQEGVVDLTFSIVREERMNMFHFLHSRKLPVQVCMTNSFARSGSTRSLVTLLIVPVFVLLGCHVKSRENERKKN